MTLACGVIDNLRIVKHLFEIVIISSIFTQWHRSDPDWSLLPETACQWESASSGDFQTRVSAPHLPCLLCTCHGLLQRLRGAGGWDEQTSLPQQYVPKALMCPILCPNGSCSTILKSTFTLPWSKYDRARKDLDSTKAIFLFNGKCLFWEYFT